MVAGMWYPRLRPLTLQIEEEAARKQHAEDMVQFQIAQAEQASSSNNEKVAQLTKQVAQFEEMLR